MSNKRGAVAESIVCTAALNKGLDVCFPARGLSPAYDMLVRGDKGDWNMVQVKRAYERERNGATYLRVNITDGHGDTYPPSDVTVIAIVDVDTHRVWFIPRRVLGGQKTVALTSGKWDRWLL